MAKQKRTLKSIIAGLLTFSMIVACSPNIIIANAETLNSGTITKLTTESNQGTILHAWDWSFNNIKNNVQAIKNAGYSAIQVSPVEPSKDDSATTNAKWYMLYQPINFTVGNVQLGTEQQFQAMCTAAHDAGLKIIVDVVTNHTGNNEGDGNKTIAPQVTFQGTGYEDYWHLPLHAVTDWNDRYEVTHGGLGLPDLNTSNSNVQAMIKTFLQECLTDGADGFRFDTAKHIELPSPLDKEGTCSDYWPNILSGLKTKQGTTPFVYGEDLQGGADNFENYTKLIDVTASNYGDAVRSIVGVGSSSTNLSDTNFSNYKTYNVPEGVDPSSLVTWVESHDTYANDGGASENMTDEQIKLGWALTAPRAASTPLFFNRTAGRSKLQGNIGDTGNSNWKDPDVIAINKFRNAMEGYEEKVTKVSDKVIMIERVDQGVTKGVVIVNLGSAVTDFTETAKLATGSYTNCSQNGGIFTSNGTTLSGNLTKGITVLYEGGTPETAISLPKVSIDKENCTFNNTLELNLKVQNSTIGKYSIDDGTEIEYTDGQTITIGEGVAIGAQLKVIVKASNSDGDASEVYLYTKKDESSLATIYFKKPSGWTIPYVNIYNDYSETNGAWPGAKMTKIGDGFYKYELTGWADAKVQLNDNYDGHKTDALNLEVNGKMVYDNGTWKAYDSSYDSLIDPNVTPDEEVEGTSKVYFMNTQNWQDVNIYYYTNVGGFKQVNGGWPGAAMKDEGNGLFSYTLPKAFEGASILFNTSTGNTQIPASGGFVAPANSSMICVAEASGQKGTWKEYIEEGTSKIYFRKPSDWAEPKVYAYKIEGNTESAVTGQVNNWPGVAMTKVDGAETLYSYTFSSDCKNVNVIFNDGKNQYPSSGGYQLFTGESKIYDDGNLRDFTTDDLDEPEEPAVAGQGVTKVYFENTENWNNVKIYYWQDGSPSITWPGVSMVKEGDNLYSYNLPSGYESAKIIFNNNGQGSQTVNLSTQVGSTMKFVSSGINSEGKLEGQLENKSKVYFKNTLGWNSVKVHYWKDGGTSTTWPGVSMVNEGDDLYSYTLPEGYETANVIFNNNGSGQQTKTIQEADKETSIFVPSGEGESTSLAGEWRAFTAKDVPGYSDSDHHNNDDDDDTIGSNVYVKVPVGWSGVPNIHYWNTAGDTTAWPGKAMIDKGNGLYSYGIPKSFGDVTIIINDGSNKLANTEGNSEFSVPLGSSIIFENGEWAAYTSDENETETSEMPTTKGNIYNYTTTVKGTAGENANIKLTATTSAAVTEEEIGTTTADKDGNWSAIISSQKKGTVIKITAQEDGKKPAAITVTVKKKSSSSSHSTTSSNSNADINSSSTSSNSEAGENSQITKEQETPIATSGWEKLAEGTWTYINSDGIKVKGWLKNNEKWYFLKDDGIMATGWIKDGAWYFLNGSGAMATGWLKDTDGAWYYLSSSGSMNTGWVNDKGTWYYLNRSGAMLYNTTVDGYRLGSNGAWNS